MKCKKTEYCSHGGSNFANDFLSRQACQNAVYQVLYFSSNYSSFMGFFTRNNGIIMNNIEKNVLLYSVVRVIPHFIY